MKPLLALAVLLGASACIHAQAKPCEELKGEIAKKLEAKGVVGYSLDIVAKDAEGEGKQVGSCEGGTKKILYKRGAPAEKEKPGEAAKK